METPAKTTCPIRLRRRRVARLRQTDTTTASQHPGLLEDTTSRLPTQASTTLDTTRDRRLLSKVDTVVAPDMVVLLLKVLLEANGVAKRRLLPKATAALATAEAVTVLALAVLQALAMVVLHSNNTRRTDNNLPQAKVPLVRGISTLVKGLVTRRVPLSPRLRLDNCFASEH